MTHFSEVVLNPTRLELDGVAVRDTDSDSDGLPDDWETFYFTNLVQTAAADTDGDGASHLAEFHAGTDPAQGASVLRIVSVAREAGLTTLRFPHAAGRACSVEFSENFSGWTALTNAPVFELPTGVVRWTDDSPGSSHRFHRIRVEAPLP